MANDAERARSRRVALDLMRMALALLDRAEEGFAAARLQHAIDTVGAGPATPVVNDASLPTS